MKTVHITDVHEDFDAVKVVADYAQALGARIVLSGDMNLKGYTRSDLDAYKTTRDRAQLRKAVLNGTGEVYSTFKSILDGSGVPYMVLPGNYDSSAVETVFGEHNLDRKTQTVSGIKYLGFGGGQQTPMHIAYLEDIFNDGSLIARFDEDELSLLLRKEQPTVAVTHQPPEGFLDYTVFRQHWGTPVLTQYLIEASPKLVLVGHVHESGPMGNNAKGYKGIAKVGDTVLVNSGNLGRFDLIDAQTMDAITGRILCRGRDPRTVPEREKVLDWGTFGVIDQDTDGTVTSVAFYSVMSPDKKTVNPIRELARHTA